MNKGIFLVLVLSGLMLWAMFPGTAAAQFLDGDNGKDQGGSSDSKPKPLKPDPVLQAFALPRGIVLSSEEMKFAKGVRDKLEPQLRSAFQRIEQAEDEDEKLKAAKDIKQIKTQIRAAIATILQRRMMIAAQEAAKRRAEEMKKAQARRGNGGKGGKKGHNNKRRRRK